MRTERNVLAIAKHRFVCNIDWAFQTDKRLYLIMDYCPGGDLQQYLLEEVKFSEEKTRKYMAEIILAVESLHE